MKIFAISDLHLSGENVTKPMDIFGDDWADYVGEIKADWLSRVKDEDLVLIGGDISWAMDLDAAMHDLDFIGSLPGKKILVRGNHDYWWKSISQIRARLAPSVFALQNDSLRFDGVVICGTRGWTVPEVGTAKEDIKIYNREVERLKLSLHNAKSKLLADDTLICLTHFPPFNTKCEDSGFTELFAENGVKKVVYGHLHGPYARTAAYIEKNGVGYYLTSCDKVKNKLVEIFQNMLN